MATSDAKPKFSLRLLIDNEKKRVVLAEAGKDFVDILCSLLSLPMGTIVRLLEKQQNPQSSIVGCFHNLYKSVSDMDLDDFQTDACKDLLLYPRSLRRNPKLNIDDTKAMKFFLCPKFMDSDNCSKAYSYLSTTRCSGCESLMTREIGVEEEQTNEVFVGCRTSFIITDDLKVALNSTGHLLNVLNDLGYAGFRNLQEKLIDVGFEDVVTLLGSFFTSEAPLTDAFLRKDCTTMKCKKLSPLVQETTVAVDSDKLLTLKVYLRKTDNVILYAECREDFVDFLFTFLAIPLEFAWELSVDSVNRHCISNLFSSLKELIFEQRRKSQVYRCMLPCYYNIRAQLLDVDVEELPEYELVVHDFPKICGKLSKKIYTSPLFSGAKILKLKPVDLRVMVTSGSAGVGFLKRETTFIVSDDLVVTPAKLCSEISMLSKLKTRISDIEERVIVFGKSEAISLLRASLITSSALNNGLSKFLSKMKPTPPSSKSQKYNAIAVPTEYNVPLAEKVNESLMDPSKFAVSVAAVSAAAGGGGAQAGAGEDYEGGFELVR